MPTDHEFLTRLHETPFSELTESEVAALVDRAAASPAVRDALAARIQLEQALHAHFEEPTVSTAELLQSIRRRPRARMRLVVAALAVAIVLTGVIIWRNQAPPTIRSESGPSFPTVNKNRTASGERPVIHQSPPRRPPVEAARPDVPSAIPVATTPAEILSEPIWLRTFLTSIDNVFDVAADVNHPVARHLLFPHAGRASFGPLIDHFRASQLAGRLGNAIGTVAPDVPRRFQDHPLATEPHREGVALSLELEAALESGSLADAARLIPTVAEVRGLVPALGDSDRMVPPAALIETAVTAYPSLATALEKAFGEQALQAVRQAIPARNQAAIERIAVRFHGTRAAGEARRWLGDLALATGRTHEARQDFHATLATAPEDERSNIQARLDLTLALAGSPNEGSEITSPVSFGPQTIVPTQWNALLAEMNASHRPADPVTAPEALPTTGPREARELFAIIEGLGRNLEVDEHQWFDWTGRQLAAKVYKDRIYISNRFQVIAYNPAREHILWTTALGPEQGDAHAWPNIPFTPLIYKNRLFVRRLLGSGPELAALSLDEGTALWRIDDDLTVVSEPWIRNGELLAVTTPHIRRGDRPVVLSLTRFRADDGQVLEKTPLFILDADTSEEPAVHVTPLAHGFCLLTRGAAGCFDDNGQTRWLRRLPFLPAGLDPHPGQAAVTPPLAVNHSLYLAIPDARQILCLDINNGRQLWARPLDQFSRLITANADVVVARADDGLLGLDSRSGVRTWSLRLPNLLDAALYDSETLLVAQHLPDKDGRHRLALAWIERSQGTLRDAANVALDVPTRAAGPFVRADGKTYLFLEGRPATGERTFIEFMGN